MKVIAIGDTVHTVEQLQEFLSSQCTSKDIVVLESIDLITGDVEDLFPFHMDVIEGIETSNGIVNEVRFCQEKNTDEVQKPLIPEFMRRIDWALLREQKTVLLNVIHEFETTRCKGHDNKTEIDGLEGILTLLDSLQDSAVDTYGVPEKQVFSLKPESIWNEIRSNYVDKGVNAEETTYIDAYLTEDDNEEGTVIAKVNMKTGKVEYLDDRAKDDEYAQEIIQEAVQDALDNI